MMPKSLWAPIHGGVNSSVKKIRVEQKQGALIPPADVDVHETENATVIINVKGNMMVIVDSASSATGLTVFHPFSSRSSSSET